MEKILFSNTIGSFIWKIILDVTSYLKVLFVVDDKKKMSEEPTFIIVT